MRGRDLLLMRSSSPRRLRRELSAYWPLDEASLTRRDVSGNGNTLADNNTVTGNPGPSGNIPLASQFTAAGAEFLSVADNAFVSMGDIDFSIIAFVYLDTKPANGMHIVAKWDGGGGQREYRVRWLNTDVFDAQVSPDGTATTTVTASGFGAPSLATWYMIHVWHNSIANTLNIQVNNGTINSVAHTTGVLNGTAPLLIGAAGTVAAPAEHWNGRVAVPQIRKRIITPQEATWYYNGGLGRSLAQLRLAA